MLFQQNSSIVTKREKRLALLGVLLTAVLLGGNAELVVGQDAAGSAATNVELSESDRHGDGSNRSVGNENAGAEGDLEG